MTFTVNTPFPVFVIWSAAWVWGTFWVAEKRAIAPDGAGIKKLTGRRVWLCYVASMIVLYLLTRGIAAVLGI